jgi:hypothetical protein
MCALINGYFYTLTISDFRRPLPRRAPRHVNKCKSKIIFIISGSFAELLYRKPPVPDYSGTPVLKFNF